MIHALISWLLVSLIVGQEAEAYSKLYQACKMEHFVKIVNS